MRGHTKDKFVMEEIWRLVIVRNTAKSLDINKAQREGVCCDKQGVGKLKTNLWR